MTQQRDVTLDDGRTVRVHDSGGPADAPAVLWHHGSPQTGALLGPLLRAAAPRGIRLLSYARPSYGGSTALLGRNVAAAAHDVGQIADAFGVERFAAMGASGGGPHALACAALLPDRVVASVCLAGIAPYSKDFDWFAGMASPEALQAALAGRQARAEFEATAEFDPSSFTAADWDALAGEWSALGADAQAAGEGGPDGLIDDDIAFATPWGFDVADIAAPVLLVQGGADRVVPSAHAHDLLRRLPAGQLWLRPRDGHISVLRACPVAFDWLLDGAR